MAARTKIFVEAIPLVEERPSGIGYALLGLVSALANDPIVQERYEVVLVAPKRGLPRLDRWPTLQHCSRKGLPLRMRIIRGLMRVHLFPPMDLLLGQGIYLFGNFMNWKVTKKSSSYTYIHDVAFALYPQFVSPKLQKVLIRKVPGFIKQTDYVVTVSESSKQEIQDYFRLPASKILVLPNGVDESVFHPHDSAATEKAKQVYGISGKYFIFVSNIEPRKNVTGLIKAFYDMPREYSLVLVGGSGWLNEDALLAIEEARAAGLSIIKPTTYVPSEDVAALMSGAEALVHPAFHEGFGLTPLEAMSCGTPTVLADIPSLHEVSGEGGIYCDPRQSSDIARAMKQVLAMSEKERKTLIDKNKQRASQFSWKNTARVFYNFLQANQGKKG